jgi:hypothetical protein
MHFECIVYISERKLLKGKPITGRTRKSMKTFSTISRTTPTVFGVLVTVFVGHLLAPTYVKAQDWTNIPDTSQQGWTEPQPYVTAKAANSAVLNAARSQAVRASSAISSQGSTVLPLWFYDVVSSRDNNGYFGIMIGNDPFNVGGSAEVSTYIVPLIIRTNTIGVGYDSTTGVITTAPGVTTFDPTIADRSCMTYPNDVPVKVFRESPIFEKAGFSFGGTRVGHTQYLDAFQRASFWNALQDKDAYHVLLNPVNLLAPVVINVPAPFGTTRPTSSTVRTTCGAQGIVDINWLDFYLSTVVLPALAEQGVNSGSLPIFQLYNVAEAFQVTNLRACCILGYHGANGPPIQTYAVADFDTTGFFAAGVQDTGIISHEIGEWINDPFVFNLTPLWGHTGQVGGCQANLEVGDPLTGNLAPSVIMPNGFTYHLQELAFYSWFLGGPSIGINGWYSNNASFLKDAGPTCH